MSTPRATRPLSSDRSLSTLLDDAFSLYRLHLRLLLVLAAAIVVPVELAVSGIGLGQLTSDYDEEVPVSAFAVQTGVSALVITPLITLVVVRVLLRAEEGATPSAGDALRAALDLFAAALLVVVMVALLVFVGLLALIVPGVIALVHLSVAVQSFVVEGTRGPDALRRSWELVRGDAWWTLGVLVVTNLLAGVLAALVTLPLEVGAEEADTAALSLLGLILGEILTLSFLAVVSTLLFFTLRARKDGVPEPAPTEASWTSPAPAAGWAPPRSGDDDGPDLPPPPPRTPDARPAPDPQDPPPAPPGWEPPRPG